MKRKEILNVLSNEDFDVVYSSLCEIFGEDIVEQFYVLPNVKKVVDLVDGLAYNIEAKGEKWLIIKLQENNFDLCDKLDTMGLFPFWGEFCNYSEFINK